MAKRTDPIYRRPCWPKLGLRMPLRLMGRRIILAMSMMLATMLSPSVRGQSAGPGDRDTQFERATRLLRQATQPRLDGEHILLLRGLRQLHDEGLRPFFTILCQSENPLIQVHAILESAALSADKRVDPWKLSQLDRVELRRGALAEAISNGFVGAEEYRAVLDWPDLDDSIKSVVLVTLAATDEPPRIEVLVALMTESDSPIVRARCAVALLHLGEPEGTAEALDSLRDLPPSIREAAVASLLALIRTEDYEHLSSWLRSLATSDEGTITYRLAIIRTLLAIAPEEGRAFWHELYESTEGVANKLRCSLVLLALADRVEVADFAGLEAESFELLTIIGQVGAAIASGSPAVEECNELLQFDHPPSALWVLEHARTLREQNAEAAGDLFEALIEKTMHKGRSMEDRLELAVLASGMLTKLDYGRLRGLLEVTLSGPHRLTQEAILAGAWQSRSSNAAPLIDGIEEWSSVRAGAMALLIKADHTAVGSLSSDDLQRLTLILGGARHVSPGYRVQAAWLYLRHTEREGPALATVLGDFIPQSVNDK